jgi:hypothetical protein
MDFRVRRVASRRAVRSPLRTVPLEELQKRFGEESIWVYNILRVSLLCPFPCPFLFLVWSCHYQ